jgi:HAD superfamily hydrolase (TIGR01509 family)
MEKELLALRDQVIRSQGFIFDMDGTVVDLEELNFTSFKTVISQELGKTLTNPEYQEHISGRGSRNGLQSYLDSVGEEEEKAEELQHAYRSLKRQALLHMFDDVVEVKEGIRTLLSLLSSQGKTSSLVTATGQDFTDIILSGTKLVFNHVITRDDVDKIKPDPEIFLLTLERTGISAKRSIVFEDSINGILAAQRAGIFCAGIHNPGLNDDFINEADAVIDTFHPVSNALSSY